MKVAILGANGMLGKGLRRAWHNKQNMNFIYYARDNADVCCDFTNTDCLKQGLEAYSPDVVINTAAITDLRHCEAFPDVAHRVNAELPGMLSDMCREISAYFIHISTDHYYSGDDRKHHKEDDKVMLLNEYARSKYAGEKNALKNGNSLVIRTNIVGFRDNTRNLTFLEWAISSIKNNCHIKLFDDFFTSSMFTEELAQILENFMENRPVGILNVASRSVSSKEEFVLELSQALFHKEPDYDVAHVNDILDIKRANSLGLDVAKAENILGYKLPALDRVIYDIKSVYEERYL